MSSPVALGALLLLVAEILFAGVGAMIKHLSEHLNQTQLVFFRSLFALVPLVPWLFKNGKKGLATQRMPLHFARSCSGLVAMYCFFYVLSNIPLAQAMMVLLIAPFIVPLISMWWLKESISRLTWLAISIGFIGATIALKPPQQGYDVFIYIAFFAACLVAFSKVSIRKLTTTEPSTRIVFYFSMFSVLVSLIPMALNWQPITLEHWGWLIIMGITAGTGQLLFTKAFQLASPARIGLLTYSSVLFAAIFGYLFWQETFTLELVIGSALIFWAAYMSTRQRFL